MKPWYRLMSRLHYERENLQTSPHQSTRHPECLHRRAHISCAAVERRLIVFLLGYVSSLVSAERYGKQPTKLLFVIEYSDLCSRDVESLLFPSVSSTTVDTGFKKKKNSTLGMTHHHVARLQPGAFHVVPLS